MLVFVLPLLVLPLLVLLLLILLLVTDWNNTGPTGYCPSSKKPSCCNPADCDTATCVPTPPQKEDGPGGLCTSVVAQQADGSIVHGRNLDWNLNPSERKLVINVNYVQKGRIVYTSTQPIGFVGVLNGIRHPDASGTGGWSFSMNARQHGGPLCVIG